MAERFALPDGDSVIGEFGQARAEHQDTLLDIARHNGLGYNEIRLANEHVDTWLPGDGQEVVLPKRYILPATPREGLVLNIPEMRLYHYTSSEDGEPGVVTYPLGVGRQGWSTPYETTTVTAKVADPAWYPPESIREEHAAEGDPLPSVVPAGPDNPLGAFAMRLGLPSYLIHGTNRPWGVGMRVSHGCIRLYPEHIEALFEEVEVGTVVRIINQPFKIGMKDEVLYLEVHPHLQEDKDQFANAYSQIVSRVLARIGPDTRFEVDWELAREVTEAAQGVPIAIGMRLPEVQATRAATVNPRRDLPLAAAGGAGRN
ncbi:L,D-transpeptidase ErfK/SrfK [Methylohalomonas lacus]|uniref:L,D-transpeptidase ErfK/SrfK n=1 Tax=Methylohalomonas lacus TaxID=398773 RepID=A0AAE3HKB9_9GAMM|nr:L,D-transpeptidase family protein [Methylohalomonas lacus]MCS3902716.1 L,D-transpeptidase ErfK/SrfK [Methylohalomonas lacus]